MSDSEASAQLNALLNNLGTPFFRAGESVVYITFCCGHVFVGVRAPKRCKHCQAEPLVSEWKSTEPVTKLVETLREKYREWT